jgi:hypothetical protein
VLRGQALKTLESRVICTSQHVCIQHILRSRNFSLLNSFLHCNRSLFLFGLLGWGLEPTLLILDLCPRTPYLNPTNSAGTHSLALFNLLNRRTKNCGRFLEVSPRKGLKCYPCEIRRTKAPEVRHLIVACRASLHLKSHSEQSIFSNPKHFAILYSTPYSQFSRLSERTR